MFRQQNGAEKATQALNLCAVSFPYTTSQATGRGLDRYSYQLTQNIASECPGVSMRLVDRGSLGSAGAVVKRVPWFLGRVLAERPDIYHALTPQGGAILAGLGRTPLVVTIHDVIPLNVDARLDSPQKYWLWRHMLRICLRRSDAIIVPYQVTKDEIVARLGGDPSKIFVVNYGVDHGKYYPRPELPRAPNRVVYLGEVSRSKGVDVLMRAFALVKETVPAAELVIAGKPSQDGQLLRELSDSLQVKNMTLGGFISEEELPSYYATASAMVFPSRCGFGLSTLEAMACGTPVVVARVLDAPEFVGDAGLLAEPDSPEDLARQLTRALTDTELRAQLSEKAVRRAQEFSWARMARETVKVYEEVLRRRFR